MSLIFFCSSIIVTNERTSPCSLRFPAPVQFVYSVAASACPVRPSRTRRAKSSPWKRSVSRTLDAIEAKSSSVYDASHSRPAARARMSTAPLHAYARSLTCHCSGRIGNPSSYWLLDSAKFSKLARTHDGVPGLTL
jgi:hypothetical protein